MSKDETDYTDDFVAGLELSWGEGFLSPGGSEEVTRILKSIDIRGKKVLDIGSGLGGPAICLALKHGAGQVVGIDIEALNVERATRSAAKADVSDRVEFMTVEAGNLPFDDNSFDVVFSKDAITETPDKKAVFSEAVRVLRPQGWLAVSDWFRGSEDYSREMLVWMEGAGVTLEFVTLEETADLLMAAGLSDVETEDRNAWYQDCVKEEVARMAGPDRHLFEALLGKEDADIWIAASERRSFVVAQGQLRPGHLRARKR